MIDKAAIFESILKKNALRRDAGLKEWPVRETYQRCVELALWHDFLLVHGARVRAELLAEQRARYGADWPQSGGGWMAYSCLVSKAMTEEFKDRRGID